MLFCPGFLLLLDEFEFENIETGTGVALGTEDVGLPCNNGNPGFEVETDDCDDGAFRVFADDDVDDVSEKHVEVLSEIAGECTKNCELGDTNDAEFGINEVNVCDGFSKKSADEENVSNGCDGSKVVEINWLELHSNVSKLLLSSAK